ncbi:MAG TPA: hypothetical protein VMD09_17710 [Solirubrobacteraceae bacterium]|nr:hypothetical protein [Solirubrobacteraceae bacterium]
MSVSGRQPGHHFAKWSARVICTALVALVALAGCGSSKPAYCSARTNLQNSVKGLTNLNSSSGISGLKAQLDKIQSDANTLINQAKSDFPSQTSAIKSSLDGLESAVKGLPSSPSASQIAGVAASASGLVSSVKNFFDATSSKCS